MTEEQPKDLDQYLDRLMETAYEALDDRVASTRSFDEPQPDQIGPYRVSGLLGRGGTSCVFKAHDPELGRDLAIKVIDACHAPDLAKRFLDEARICSQLSHPGIVPIYSIGTLDDGRPYFTMRLVEGETLAVLLQGRADPEDRLQHYLEVFARICETVAFAHARGIVHGDLKPGNVMIGAFGQVQVMDWGFSRLLDGNGGVGNGAGGAADARGRVMGTPAFMAPEQARDHAGSIDARTDVFGLGAILCVVLTGCPPFLGSSRSEVHVRAASGFLGDALARLRACTVDPALVQLAVECLALAPTERPTDAAAVATRLSDWFASIKERAHRLELAAAKEQAKAAEQLRTRRRTRALTLLAAALVAIYIWTRFERQGREYEVRMVVVQAIERARNLRSGADVAGSERTRMLGEAALAAQHARTVAATIEDEALRRQAGELADRLEHDRVAAVQDAAMMRWLEDFPSHLDLTRDQLDAHFTAGFRDYGVDVEKDPAEALVARLRSGSIGPALARALDDWGFTRRELPGVEAAAWRRFHDLALRVDEDALRTGVRHALLDDDLEALRQLATSAPFQDAPTDTLDLLANCLDRLHDRQGAIDVWQRANAKHPDNVRVIHSLAVHHFGDAKCPPWDEIVRLFTAGVALRPTSAHLWIDLSYALVGQGDLAAAQAALERALEIDAHDQRAFAGLIDLLRCRGEPEAAVTLARSITKRAPDAAATWRVCGDAAIVDGRLDEAADAYRRAVALDANSYHLERLGQCLLEFRQLDEAEHCLRLALDPSAPRATPVTHLGLTLRLRGHFAEALVALRRGRQLGDAAWQQRCDAWIAETERAEAAAATLANLRNDGDLPAAPTVELALAAFSSARPLLSARCYQAVFEQHAEAANRAFAGWNLDWALQAAVAAANADASQRDVWRSQAVTWLRAGLVELHRAYAACEQSPANVRQRLAIWRQLPGLSMLLPDVQTELDALAELIGKDPQTIVQAPFDQHYAYRELGRPAGVLSPYGGLLLDDDVLVIAGQAQRITAALHAVTLQRDAEGHVSGFRSDTRRLAAAPFADGGLARGERGTLLYTRYPNAEMGELGPGSRVPERVLTLPGASAGGLAIVPATLPGSGRIKFLTWPGGEWFDAERAVDPASLALARAEQVTTLSGGPDGFAYVDTGTMPFDRPTLLVCEWSRHSIAAYDVDANGDPIVGTRRLFASNCRGVLALALDRATGDLLVSTWRGDGTEQLGVFRRIGR